MQVHGVRPFTIHGDLYYEVDVTSDPQPGELARLKVPQHAVQATPEPGQRFSVTFLMGQITSMTRLQGDAPPS